MKMADKIILLLKMIKYAERKDREEAQQKYISLFEKRSLKKELLKKKKNCSSYEESLLIEEILEEIDKVEKFSLT